MKKNICFLYKKNMAHFLTTNWTEQIKKNPTANRILNSNKYQYRTYRVDRVTGYRRLAGRGYRFNCFVFRI